MCDMDFGDDGGMDIGASEDLTGDEAEAMDMDIEEYQSLSEFDGVEQAGELTDFSQLDDISVNEDAEQSEGEIKIQDIYPDAEASDVSNDNMYQERWREFGEDFSDSSESDGWDTLNDVPFSEAEQTEIDVVDEVIDTQTTENTNDELQELGINYDEIYEGLGQEDLNRTFENINIDADPERLEASLESFQQQTWDNLTMDEQKESMSDLANYVIETVGFDNPPHIEYYNNPRNGDYGGYTPIDNTLHVNEYMLADSEEAADTIAHELWHAHQRECANNPKGFRDYQYQFNYENYITPEMGHEAYENQLIEVEARAFAQQFKGRIQEMSGRRFDE